MFKINFAIKNKSALQILTSFFQVETASVSKIKNNTFQHDLILQFHKQTFQF